MCFDPQTAYWDSVEEIVQTLVNIQSLFPSSCWFSFFHVIQVLTRNKNDMLVGYTCIENEDAVGYNERLK